MCISDETFDKIREAWARSIPKQYRYTGRDRPQSHNITDRHLSPAIILPSPPVAILERWLALVCKPHLTEAQHKEQARREAMKRGPKKRDWSARRRRRAAAAAGAL